MRIAKIQGEQVWDSDKQMRVLEQVEKGLAEFKTSLL